MLVRDAPQWSQATEFWKIYWRSQRDENQIFRHRNLLSKVIIT